MKDLQWGETPWDHLTRGELLRELQRTWSAMRSLASALDMCRLNDPHSPYWGAKGTGGRALEKTRQILEPLFEHYNSEQIYRVFFRYADDLLFANMGFGWDVCPICAEMLGATIDGSRRTDQPCFRKNCAGIMRPLQWSDLAPETESS